MDVLGVEVGDLPEGFAVAEVIVIIKGFNSDGDLAVSERVSAGLNSWEALGMVITLGDSLRDELKAQKHPE